MTATLDMVETAVLDSLDFEQHCEVRYAWFANGKPTGQEVQCDHPARWAGNYPCCGHLAILCNEHVKPEEAKFHCVTCDTYFGVESLVGLRPIK